MSLTYTPGGASDNSYATRAEADSYFADHLYATDWTGASNATKEAALVTATRRIDEESFRGLKTSSGQALKWPRTDVYDEDGNAFDSGAIPARVKEATFVVAIELIRANFLAENYLNNFEFLSTGTMQFKQFTQQSAGRLPADAIRLLRLLMVASGGGRVTRA